jgi:hypothetical protein
VISTAHIAILTTLVLGGAPPPGSGDGVFIPGHEAAVVGLLAPDDLDSFRCGAWTLSELVPGPDCAFRVRMTGPGGATATVRVGRDLAASGAAGDDDVIGCVATRIHRNAAADFFDDKCTPPEEAVRLTVRGVGGRVRLGILGLAALLALGFLIRRVRAEAPPVGGAPGATGGDSGPTIPLSLAAWVAPALALRAWLMAILPPGAYELENFGAGAAFMELIEQTGAARGWLDPVTAAFHPPLVRTLLDPWLMLGDLFGVGGTLWWLRLPNLGLTTFGVVLLVRLGARLGAPAAGRLAAVLFAWLPATVLITVFQGHYAAEMVLCLWFIERLVAWHQGAPRAAIAVPLTAALALWTGHLAALVVAPGVLAFLVTGLRRGRREEALAALLLLVALYLPIAEAALAGATGYTAASVQAPLSPDGAAATAPLGHGALPMTTPSIWDALALPWTLPARLFGPAGAMIALTGVLLLLRRRRRLAAAAGGLIVLYILIQARLSTRWENLSPLFPLCILAAALGLEALRGAPHRLAGRIPWVALFVGLSLLGGCWSVWSHADGAGITEIAGRLAWEDSETTLAARAMDDELATLPVLLLAPSDRYPYHLCPDRSTVAGVQACVLAADTPSGDAGVQMYTLGSRTIAAAEITEADGAGCPDLDRVLGAPPFDGPFLAVISWDSPVVLEDSPCRRRFRPEGCEPLAEAPGLRLLRCGEMGVAR